MWYGMLCEGDSSEGEGIINCLSELLHLQLQHFELLRPRVRITCFFLNTADQEPMLDVLLCWPMSSLNTHQQEMQKEVVGCGIYVRYHWIDENYAR